MLAWRAREEKMANVSLLVSHVLVPPALEAILASPENRVQGFLGPGHVCAVMGYSEYVPISARYQAPIVVTGFEPLDILEGVLMTVKQLEEGRAVVENQYSRVLDRDRQSAGAEADRQSIRSRATANGAALAPSPTAATGCARSSPRTTRRSSSTLPRSRRWSRRSASAARFCAASRSRTIAPPSGRCARRSIRWGQPWCRPRVRALRTTLTDAI